MTTDSRSDSGNGNASGSNWTDRIVGARMAVDNEFSERLEHSQFSRQQWGLIMTAIEFEIEHADDPDRARIVADTEKLPAILPELDRIENTSPMGGPEGSSQSGGLFSSIKKGLGLGGGNTVDEEQRNAATELAGEYATELQRHLEAQGQFEEIRTLASEGARSSDSTN